MEKEVGKWVGSEVTDGLMGLAGSGIKGCIIHHFVNMHNMLFGSSQFSKSTVPKIHKQHTINMCK